jgi:hypothetical protein
VRVTLCPDCGLSGGCHPFHEVLAVPANSDNVVIMNPIYCDEAGRELARQCCKPKAYVILHFATSRHDDEGL